MWNDLQYELFDEKKITVQCGVNGICVKKIGIYRLVKGHTHKSLERHG